MKDAAGNQRRLLKGEVSSQLASMLSNTPPPQALICILQLLRSNTFSFQNVSLWKVRHFPGIWEHPLVFLRSQVPQWEALGWIHL